MTTLTTYHVSTPGQLVLQTRDDLVIAHTLAQAGIQFERWAVRTLPADADSAAVLSAYAPEIERLKASKGYTTVDVARITPEHPDRAAMRQKFIEEHTHADDEVRFFVEGAGAFYLHLGDTVLQVLCEAGDLISVPAGTRHWFDMGPAPRFTAIRLFVSPDGWVGHFTGDPLSAAIPRLDAVAA
ncbi:cupin domain-containing protein [Rhodoferax saidenbachensis]|uniref:Acireductone dioxygenase n=1 Tax=Rhodoferax saidenbachensis TaxID=1484693 RepID=A0ABU1ZR39_9BURK|nr:cupin domain-containing protein [Rhodoferax saidenbachensis]MDR7307421.1 1,2-dihydroxy-3-keto-5-methylthiopentene dioxygenase [Rhodoferax saidenbachensis]